MYHEKRGKSNLPEEALVMMLQFQKDARGTKLYQHELEAIVIIGKLVSQMISQSVRGKNV